MLKFSAAALCVLVTTFHAARPPLRWSREAKLRATWNGSLKLVDTVAPSPTWRVTMLSAASSVIGSKRLTNDGWSPGSITTASEMKNRSNFPRSAIRAMAVITGRLQLVVNAPS